MRCNKLGDSMPRDRPRSCPLLGPPCRSSEQAARVPRFHRTDETCAQRPQSVV